MSQFVRSDFATFRNYSALLRGLCKRLRRAENCLAPGGLFLISAEQIVASVVMVSVNYVNRVTSSGVGLRGF